MPIIEDDIFQKGKPTLALNPISHDELNHLLNHGAMLITANQRLTRFRLSQFEQAQIQLGNAAWQTPNIMSWSVWLQDLWFKSNAGILLSQQQEALLWRDVVAEDERTAVLNSKALAKQAMDAWQILADYFIDPSCLLHGGEEHMALHRWAEEVSHRIHDKHHGSFQRFELLIQLKQSLTSANETIILDGFDSFNPAQLAFLAHLMGLGCQVFEVSSDAEETTVQLSIYHDEESELRFIAQHIRKLVAANPEITIGLFVPDLEQRAAQVSQILSEELAPHLCTQTEMDLEGQYFNLSLGSVLAKQPMIQAAMQLLSLSIQPKLGFEDVSSLLHNPYFKGFADEYEQRTALDKALRANNHEYITLKQLLYAAQHHEKPSPTFLDVLQELSFSLSDGSSFVGKQVLSAWLTKVEYVLSIFGWQSSAESPFEHAQLQGWKDMLHQLSSLDDFCGQLTWAEALGRLQEYAYEQLFRPAPGLANVQVMGFLEASNLRFDEAFIISMDDQTWPPAAKPHPLIPVEIQAQYQTPHANSEREWIYAQTVWQNLLHVAPHIHVSYAQTRDHQDVQPSPLLSGLSPAEQAQFATQRYAVQLQQQQIALETIKDEALPVGKDESIRGGTGILAAQSACSFQAFAKYRLKLDGLEQPTQGLNAREQGTLLHKVLELFWQRFPSQQKLLDLIDAKVLDAEIKTCIDDAWRSLKRFIPQDVQWLETRRLQRLALDWLMLESERTPFKVVEREAWRDVKLGDLVLHTKLDRVDVDNGGHRIIIDYKTGLSTANKALGERPDAPQLPAYLLAEQDKGLTVDALAFAQVRGGDLAFKGFAKEDGLLPKLKAYKPRKDQPEDWDALTHHWKDTLNMFADEFMAGEATVTPKTTQSCTYCEFEGLCRVQL